MVQVASELASQRAWREGEAAVVVAVTAMNRAVAVLVDTIAMLLETDGWTGWGIRSPEHWVQWKADVSAARAEGLVVIARRREELPVCWALFREGRLTEDAMVRIARRVPASRDAEVAGAAPGLTISQLTRVLKHLPEQPDGTPVTPKPEPERYLRRWTRADGWVHGEFCLPPDEGALVDAALAAGRDAEFRDRNDLPAGVAVTEVEARAVTWADAVVRIAQEALDGLDRTYQRTGSRGDRHQIVLHHHVDPDGPVGPGRLHLGPFVPDPVARYLGCDADVVVAIYRDGKLVGFPPRDRTPNRRLRRYLEHRDGGCVHPLCNQTRWLHAHHLHHWEDGGPTVPANLVSLCPTHHRALHHGDYTIDGNPEEGTLSFTDRHGHRIEPPAFGATPLPPPHPTPPTYRPPFGERLTEWTWN